MGFEKEISEGDGQSLFGVLGKLLVLLVELTFGGVASCCISVTPAFIRDRFHCSLRFAEG